MLKNTSNIAFLMLLCAWGLFAQKFNKAKMDSLFTAIDANNRGMGSFSMSVNGKPLYYAGFGYADVGEKTKNNEKTKYRIGSISKTFTAVLILQAIEKKKLSLDTKLSVYFPQITNADKITIEQMLRHRSGIFNFTDTPTYLNWNTKALSREALVDTIKNLGSSFEPDSKMGYSNGAYVLLSLIVEKIEGKDFSAVVQENIIKPLKLKNTYYGGKIEVSNNEAKSYTNLEGWEESPETDMSIPVGAGSMVSNPKDLNAFFYALFSGKLISKATLELMTTPKDNFGMGIFIIPFYDHYSLGHTGGIDAFQSVAAYFPKEKLSIAYNSNGVVTPMNDVLIGALSIYFGKEYTIPTFTTLKLSPEQLAVYVGVYKTAELPIELTISADGSTLKAQATGQEAFALEAYEIHKFKFEPAGVDIQFNPEEKKLTLKQAGRSYVFDKK